MPETTGVVWISWFMGLLTALLLFVSVLLHELGHSLVALREGVKVRSITLFPMGVWLGWSVNALQLWGRFESLPRGQRSA